MHVGNYKVLLKTLMTIQMNGRLPGSWVGRLDAKMARDPT